MARAKLPTEIKRLKGTLQKCRTNHHEPQFERIDWIPAPTNLGDIAVEEWNRVIALLGPAGVIQKADLSMLEAYCAAFENYRVCLDLVTKTKPAIKDAKGNLKKNPLWQQLNECLTIMLRYATEFGLTPVARSRVVAQQKRPGGDFDDF